MNRGNIEPSTFNAQPLTLCVAFPLVLKVECYWQAELRSLNVSSFLSGGLP